MHCRSWKDLCFPTEEGGIGVRSIETLIHAFSGNLWWNLRKNEALWADFFHKRYVKNLHLNQVSPKPFNSHIWSRMLKARALMEPKITWNINSGIISAAWDNWSGLGILGLAENVMNCPVISFITRESWDRNTILDWWPEFPIHMLQNDLLCLSPTKADTPIWMAEPSGLFSIKSAYNLLREKKINTINWQEGLAQLSAHENFLLYGQYMARPNPNWSCGEKIQYSWPLHVWLLPQLRGRSKSPFFVWS